MSAFPDNLWAPWRMEYIRSLSGDKPEGCFFCDYRDATSADASNHVLWRTAESMVVMNRFPYTNGHLLVAPLAHRADFIDISEAALCDLWKQTRDAKTLLTQAVGAQGFNIGINFGLCAGAGVPDHLHVHVVPRWNGDTNFMAVLGDVRVIPEGLDKVYGRLKEAAGKMGLPK
jgi:ATP adenylyltransferase